MIEPMVLLERCRKGDDLAWEALVRQFQSRIYAMAYHYLRNGEEAQDLAQEAFIRIYKGLHTFKGNEGFVAWMLACARNCCIDRIRRLKARPATSDVIKGEAPDNPDRGPNPEESLHSNSRKNLVHQALGHLNQQNREIIVLKEIQGLKIQQIAAILGIPAGTVKSRSNRARLELAKAVASLDPSYALEPTG